MTRITGRMFKDPWVQEVPSGLINGSNVTYTLSSTPSEDAATQVLLDGITQRITTDYSISGVTITMVVAPATAQDLYCIYVEDRG